MVDVMNLMQWLAAGVPLTLLVDLLDECGPDSTGIYADEPGDANWLRVLVAA